MEEDMWERWNFTGTPKFMFSAAQMFKLKGTRISSFFNWRLRDITWEPEVTQHSANKTALLRLGNSTKSKAHTLHADNLILISVTNWSPQTSPDIAPEAPSPSLITWIISQYYSAQRSLKPSQLNCLTSWLRLNNSMSSPGPPEH